MYLEDTDEDIEEQKAVAASLSRSSGVPPLSPAHSTELDMDGGKVWKRDFNTLKAQWGAEGQVEGYAGMIARIESEREGKFG